MIGEREKVADYLAARVDWADGDGNVLVTTEILADAVRLLRRAEPVGEPELRALFLGTCDGDCGMVAAYISQSLHQGAGMKYRDAVEWSEVIARSIWSVIQRRLFASPAAPQEQDGGDLPLLARVVNVLEHASEILAEEVGCDCDVPPDAPCAMCECDMMIREIKALGVPTVSAAGEEEKNDG